MKNMAFPTALAVAIMAPLGSDPKAQQNTEGTPLSKFPAPDIRKEGYRSAALSDIPSERLIGQRVYTPRDQWIGVIKSILPGPDDAIYGVVMHVGGLFGIAERAVGVDAQSLTVLQAEGSRALRVYLNASGDELERLPRIDP